MNQIEKAKTIAWKEIRYSYYGTSDHGRLICYGPSTDGNATWHKSERECAYKAPGIYREVTLDEKGQVDQVRITDEAHKKELYLYPRKKKADLAEVAIQTHDPRGPFVDSSEDMKSGNLQWAGKRKTATGEVNVFRSVSDSDGRNWSFDLWIDQKTKQLVREQIPGADIYDPENDTAHNNPIGENWPNGSPVCIIVHDIVFDANLDESLFRLEPPEGYTVHVERRNYVTEQEMIDWIGILAGVNDETFPGRTYPDKLSLDEPSRERQEEIWQKPEKERTAAEQKYVEALNHYVRANLNQMPIYHFITDNAVEKSFRYFGKGVKLGDKAAIVCWYKLKGAKTYRVVYGDLSVKDVAPEDLPLRVEP